jgi:hypothetical protein
MATNRPVREEHVTEIQFALLGMVADNHDDPLSEYADVVTPFAMATNRPVTGEHVTETHTRELGRDVAVHKPDPVSE